MKTWRNVMLAFLVQLTHGDVLAHSIAATANVERGSNGAAIHLSLPLSDTVNARFGFNNYMSRHALAATAQHNTLVDTLQVDVKRKIDNYDVLLDWFPFNNYVRLTTGLVISNMTTTTLIKPGWHTGHAAGDMIATELVVHDRTELQPVPYLGLGLGLPDGRSYKRGLSLDVGILFQRTPSIFRGASYCTTSNTLCQQLADIAARQKQQIGQYFDHRRYFMARIGFTYRF